MRKIKKVLAAILGMSMLLGSISVFAVEEESTETAGSPTWGDIWQLDERADSILGEEAWWASEDGWEFAIKHAPEGTKIVKEELAVKRDEMGQRYYWNKWPEGADETTPLTGDAADNYEEYCQIGERLIETMETATGECFIEDLKPALNKVEEQIDALRKKGLEIVADDADAPKGVEWIRESDWETFNRTVDDIYENYYPPNDGWDDLTRVQCQDLIDRFTSAFDTVMANCHYTKEEETVTEKPETTETTETTEPSEGGTSETEAVAEPVQAVAATSSVNGAKSTVSGAFSVKKVEGVAFTTPITDIAAGYGLASGEKVYAKVWDLDPKKSNLAQAVIDNVAAGLGAVVGPALNIEIGKQNAAGKFSLLSRDGSEVTIKVGIPAGFAQPGKTFAVVRVRPGGEVSVLADLDNDANTVTFTTTGGAGAYAIVKY